MVGKGRLEEYLSTWLVPPFFEAAISKAMLKAISPSLPH